MSRRKRASGRRRTGAKPPDERNDSPVPDRTLPEPNPPRPNKPLLVSTTILLAAWITFLLVLAVMT